MNNIHDFRQITLRQAYALAVGGNWGFAARMMREGSFEKDFLKFTKSARARAYLRGRMDALGLVLVK